MDLTSDLWDSFANWQLVLPPNRPGTEVLGTIRCVLARRPKPRRAAVLGSTSEYLDLLVHLGVTDITCFDRSSVFHRRSQDFRQFPNVEKLILGDWMQSLRQAQERFDVILSDFTLGNLSYETQAEYLSLVAKSLAPTGIFIDRVLTFRRPCYSYDSLIEHFLPEPSNLVTLNAFNAMWLFCGQRVEQTELVDSSSTYAWTLAEFDEPHIRWLASNCHKLSPMGSSWYYGKPWRELEQVYRRSLNVIAEFPEPSNSPYSGWAFVIVSQARQ